MPDNLERAASVVPSEALKEDGSLAPEKLRGLLSGLLEGVRATESILIKVRAAQSIHAHQHDGCSRLWPADQQACAADELPYVRLTVQVLKQHGVERYDALGQPFDPNLHSALFDVPAPDKENNTVAVVTKVCRAARPSFLGGAACLGAYVLALWRRQRNTGKGTESARSWPQHCPRPMQKGYKLNDRVIRPAEVGVVRNA